MKNYLGLAFFLFLVVLASSVGGLFPPGEWYAALAKPPLNPPNWLFAPAWAVLYIAMAVAAWLVWKSEHESISPLVLWGIQLALNALWSYLFFGLQMVGVALIEVVIMLAFIIVTCISFFRANITAGWLMVPYIVWVTFATYLNAGIWWLNR